MSKLDCVTRDPLLGEAYPYSCERVETSRGWGCERPASSCARFVQPLALYDGDSRDAIIPCVLDRAGLEPGSREEHALVRADVAYFRFKHHHVLSFHGTGLMLAFDERNKLGSGKETEFHKDVDLVVSATPVNNAQLRRLQLAPLCRGALP